MSTQRRLVAVCALAVSLVAFLMLSSTVLAGDPVVPDPVPAPASPSLLPPYAVWEADLVEGVGPVNGFDMAVADDGTIHLVYGDATTGALIYMWGAPSAWLTSTVEISPGLRFIDPTIVLDRLGAPHIAYIGRYYLEPCGTAPLRSVRYSTRQQGMWSAVDVISPTTLAGGDPGVFAVETKLILDGAEAPWIAWTQGHSGPPKGGTWPELRRSVGDEWQDIHMRDIPWGTPVISLATDLAGRVHWVFTALGDFTIAPKSTVVTWHYVWLGETYQSHVVSSREGFHDLAFDSLGRAFVALASQELQVVRSAGSEWITMTLETGYSIDRNATYPRYLGYPDLAMRPDGLPAMAVAPASYTTPREIGFMWWDGFSWRVEGTGIALSGEEWPVEICFGHPDPYVVLGFIEEAPLLAYVDADSHALTLAHRVPVEIEPRAWLPAIDRQ